jgi:hypothetical protein
MAYCKNRRIAGIAAAALIAGAAAGGAQAQLVTFPGTVLKTCVLTPAVGALALSTAGTELGTEQSGGLASSMTVVATGGAATVTFAAPTMPTKPGAYSGTPTVSLKFSAASGATQAYTSAQSSYTGSGITLTDTVTIDAKAVDANGFPSGVYAVTTTATCSQ